MSQKCMDCNGRGYLTPDVGSEAAKHIPLADCPTCEGKGGIYGTAPYRLMDMSWSDGVVRRHRLNQLQFNRDNPSRWTVSKCDDEWEVFQYHAGHEHSPDPFDSFAEAIAYADCKARTNQGETK